MRWLGAGCLALGLAATAARGQDSPQLFAPAPKTPAQPADARTVPVVRTSLSEPVPVPIPRPEIRSTLTESVAEPATQRLSAPEAPPAPVPRPQYQPPPLSFADGVTATFDIPYATLPGFRPLTLDLYTPRAQTVPAPMVVFVHGDSWNNGDSRTARAFSDFPRALAALAAQGYVVASINYRFSAEAHFPAAVQDAKLAVRWLRAHAANYNIDTTRVAIWGEEAGGQVAGLVGTGCGVSSLEPEGPRADNTTPSDCVQAVIDWHGISDLAGMIVDENGKPLPAPTSVGAYLGCEPASCEPGTVRSASPISYIGPNTPPFLIQHGSHKTVPLAQSQKLFDALRLARTPVEYVTYADGETDVAKRAMEKIAQFLSQTFPKKPINKKPPAITSKALPY